MRDAVRERDHFRCAYCGSAEDEIGAKLTLDQYQPRSQGGDDTENNLVACCHACNEFKGNYWSHDRALLPLHPLHDQASEHLLEQVDHLLFGRTERGQRHIALLHLNRPELVASRQRRYLTSTVDPQYALLLGRLVALEAEMRSLSEQIRRITGGISFSPDEQGDDESRFPEEEETQ